VALYGVPEGFGVLLGAERLKGDGAAAQRGWEDGGGGFPVERGCGGFGHRNSVSGGKADGGIRTG
jgi:hypothetical protein